MLGIDEIKALMKEMDTSSISELRFEEEGTKITLRKADAFRGKYLSQEIVTPSGPPAGQQSVAAATESVKKEDSDAAVPENDTLHKITAPMVGTFYAAPSPDADPYVRKGSRIDKKTVVCTLEAMKLFNEIEAECKGTIVDILAEDGQLVEFGQTLFLVKED